MKKQEDSDSDRQQTADRQRHRQADTERHRERTEEVQRVKGTRAERKISSLKTAKRRREETYSEGGLVSELAPVVQLKARTKMMLTMG